MQGNTAAQAWDDVTSLVDHIVQRCHPTTRRALADACACADGPVVATLRAFATTLEEQIAKDEALLRNVRVLAEARVGRGPFPSPPFVTVHSQAHHVRRAHTHLNETLRQIRTLASTSGAPTTRALDALLVALDQQTRLVDDELLPWAHGLEPEREVAHVRAVKHPARASARRRRHGASHDSHRKRG